MRFFVCIHSLLWVSSDIPGTPLWIKQVFIGRVLFSVPSDQFQTMHSLLFVFWFSGFRHSTLWPAAICIIEVN